MKNKTQPRAPRGRPAGGEPDPHSPLGILEEPMRLVKEIERRKELLASLRADAERVTPTYDVTGAHGGEQSSREETYVLRTEGMQQSLRALQLDYDRALLAAESVLEQLPNPTHIAVLRLTYLEGLSVRDIARTLHYTPRHVERLRRQSRLALETKFWNAATQQKGTAA